MKRLLEPSIIIVVLVLFNKVDGNHKDMCNFISRILIDNLAIKKPCLRLIKMSSNSCQLI